jgi:hypothetical protein
MVQRLWYPRPTATGGSQNFDFGLFKVKYLKRPKLGITGIEQKFKSVKIYVK